MPPLPALVSRGRGSFISRITHQLLAAIPRVLEQGL
jgi:hypothetical protein